MPKEVIDLNEIEARVEREIFGSTVIRLSASEHAGDDGEAQDLGWCIDEGDGTYRQVPKYTDEIEAALKIMEKLGARIVLSSKGDGSWIGGYIPSVEEPDKIIWVETQDSPAMAITMAALALKGERP